MNAASRTPRAYLGLQFIQYLAKLAYLSLCLLKARLQILFLTLKLGHLARQNRNLVIRLGKTFAGNGEPLAVQPAEQLKGVPVHAFEAVQPLSSVNPNSTAL